MTLIDDYIASGWRVVPIPPGTKGPRHTGWNQRASALTKSSDLPPAYGVGLMHAYSGTAALDIDDWDRTKARGIDLDALYAAPDAVTILSGRPGRGKLLYRMPFGTVLPTKKFQDSIGRNEKGRIVRVNVFELRCGTMEDTTTQDVLPPSIHPETGLPYQWGGAGHWSRLPVLPMELLNIWMEAIKDSRPVSVDGVDSSWDEVKGALEYIDPDCSRDEWIRIGMALQWMGEQSWNPDGAFRLWNEWSAQGKKYNAREMAGQWASFRTSKGQLVTLGTLFVIARQYGWVRQQPDASTLFGPTMVKPEDIIKTLKPPPPDPNLDLWPAALTKRAMEISDTVGCDPLVPLYSGLAAVCGVVDARTRLELMPGFKVPPVLWLMSIGDPGDRKSPGSWPMIDPITGIEAEDRKRFAKAMQDFEFKEAAWAAQRTAFLKFAGSGEAQLDPSQAPEYPNKPDRPIPLRITVSDITSQQLIREAALRPRGVLCYLDELNSWVNKLTNVASGEDRSAWVQSYEAKRYQMDRVKDGAFTCENLAVAIYGNMQPQVLTENFGKLTSDGLLQRFLPAVLRHDKTRLGQPIPEFLTSADAWENTLRQTYALPPMTYRLSSDAYKVFREFQTWYEDRMHSERLVKASNEFITAFGKITGLAGRLILMFQIIEAPFSPAIEPELVERVVRIVREFVIPTYRYVFDGGEGSMTSFDQWVTEYIIQHSDLERITLSEVKRSARRQFEKAKITNSWHQNDWTIGAMYLLQQMGWVARVDDGTQEQKGIAEWLINPHLKTTFAEYRKAVVRAKLAQDQDRKDKAGLSRAAHVHGVDVLDS